MHIPDDKTLEKIWHEVPADYYFTLSPLQKLWHDRKWNVFRQMVLNHVEPPQKILEVGCAAGHLTDLLGKLFPSAHLTGIDVYKPAINYAQQKFPQYQFEIADAHNLPFADNSFDLVVMSETIEHVVDPKKVLMQIARVLKPDGHALIEMDSGSPLFRIVWELWTRFGKGKVWKHAHLHPFTEKELSELIHSCNFPIVEKKFSHCGMAVTFLLKKPKKMNAF